MRRLLLFPILVLMGCGTETASWTSDDAAETIDERAFHAAVSALEELYQDDIDAADASLRVSRDWLSDREAAWSARSGNTWRMWVYGGIARRSELTLDGWRAILCHEMGHFFGGDPIGSGGLAAEAQADYYAMATCLPRLWADEDNLDADATEQNPHLPEATHALCATLESDEAAAICRRSLRAGWTTLHMAAASRGQEPPDFLTPDETVVDRTTLRYPPVQCRLDTYLAGALRADRPSCWFAD